MKIKSDNGMIVDLWLDGRIDSNNAQTFQTEAENIMRANEGKEFTIDAKALEYISSSGLRALLSLKKRYRVERMYNVSKFVYEIMDMVGFTDIITIEKDVQQLSDMEYEELGTDYFGTLYRKDDENVVKVFRQMVTLEMVKNSDIYARAALKYDIPSAFVFEPMMDRERLACVYSAEKHAVTLGKARRLKPYKEERYFALWARLMRNLHTNLKLKNPPMFLTEYNDSLLRMGEIEVPDFDWKKIYAIVHSLPEADTLILRELSEENILIESHEMYLADMCGLVKGSPIQELTGVYVNMQDAQNCIKGEPAGFRSFLKAYMFTKNQEELDIYCAAIAILEPIHRMLRLLEQKKPLEESVMQRIREEVLLPYDEVVKKIRDLKEIYDVKTVFEVDLKQLKKENEKIFVSLDETERFLIANSQKSEAAQFAGTFDENGKFVITDIYGEIKKNGLLLSQDMCPISSVELDCYELKEIYFCIEGDNLGVYMLKNRQEKLQINIRQRTARKLLRTKTLLKDINMSLYPGEMILLIGSSGAGKTTFMNAVTGYERADASITKNQIDFYKNYEQIKYQIGFAPQQDVLRNEDLVYYTLKNAADLRLPNTFSKEEVEKRITEVLEIFGLPDLRNERVGALSGGQRKRLSIAIEFIADPILFFLDEPDSGLDGVMARALMEDLRKITGDDRIVVVISHSPDRVIDLFDKVIVLTKSEEDGAGHLAFYGTITAAKKFFGCDSMEKVLKLVNRTTEGGEGKGQYFIDKFKDMI